MLFENYYFFLSNFAPAHFSLVLDGKECEFICAEAAYQAQKNLGIADRFSKVQGKEAQQYGERLIITTPNWDQYHLYAMAIALHGKFSIENYFRKLKTIPDEEIIFDAPWGREKLEYSMYWGKYKGEGRNILGRMLTNIRDNNNDLDALNNFITEVLQKESLEKSQEKMEAIE